MSKQDIRAGAKVKYIQPGDTYGSEAPGRVIKDNATGAYIEWENDPNNIERDWYNKSGLELVQYSIANNGD